MGVWDPHTPVARLAAHGGAHPKLTLPAPGPPLESSCRALRKETSPTFGPSFPSLNVVPSRLLLRQLIDFLRLIRLIHLPSLCRRHRNLGNFD